MLPSTDLHFIPLILSEVILGTKEANKKARAIAYNLLILMGNKMLKGGTIENIKIPSINNDVPNVKAHIEEFFIMVSAGLIGQSPHMISATIISITRLLFEFKDSLKLEFITKLVDTVNMFIASNNHEIAKSALGFVKMTIICLPISIMEKRLPVLISNLMIWIHEHKGHFKAKVKNIIERMIRRYGFKTIEKEVPDKDKKLITNIRKTKERLKRKKMTKEDKLEDSKLNKKHNILNQYETYENETSDSDMSVFIDNSDFKNKKMSKKQEALIKKVDDELIDLLDKNSLVKVVSSNSKNSKKNKKVQYPIIPQFEVNSSGKIIIQDYSNKNQSGKESNASNEHFNAYLESIKNSNSISQSQSNKTQFKRKKDDDSTDTEDTIKNKRFLNNQKSKGTRNIKGSKKRKFIKVKS